MLYRGVNHFFVEITVLLRINQIGVVGLDFPRLMHIILGSVLTVFLVFTAYNLLRLALAPGEKRGSYAAGARRFAVYSLILFVIYFIWIAVKRAIF
jgi:hypothetical protein